MYSRCASKHIHSCCHVCQYMKVLWSMRIVIHDLTNLFGSHHLVLESRNSFVILRINLFGCHGVGTTKINWELHGFHSSWYPAIFVNLLFYMDIPCKYKSIAILYEMVSSISFHFCQMKWNDGGQTSSKWIQRSKRWLISIELCG